jgi:hypothetical protein
MDLPEETLSDLAMLLPLIPSEGRCCTERSIEGGGLR